ncbi:MAG: citrate synthase [Planctomycetes bacterium]|nr:citrate synthase [Planctomycetota bacterium]MCB9870328.1 citrate synthase [Planctomycetota bacterium]MCB9888093.1 citrate synthase [Planctomycetota bacterium]
MQNVISKGGLEGVVAADSAIARINGEIGELRYCGYLISDLARYSSFAETTHLLWHGELPTAADLAALEAAMAARRELPREVTELLRTIATRQQPMDALRTAVSLMSCDDVPGPAADREANLERSINLTARFPTVIAAYHRLRSGHEPIAPDPQLGHAANFLYMLDGQVPDPEIARMLDVCLVLHAEHGFNASTFAARVTAATLSDVYSALTSAIGTLKGPLHGGANTAVMEMLLQIGSEQEVDGYIEALLARRDKVMGFGHRVYKVVDPRALILRDFSARTAEITGEPKWFRMSQRVEQLIKERKGLDMNVDFYSASTYYSMGISPDLFTAVFAISRVAGWLAHVMEQYANNRLIRPRANWVGAADRDYLTMDQRG